MRVQIIHGNPNSRVSSLVWCQSGSRKLPAGRLFSSSIDGSVYEWDLFDLTQKVRPQNLATSVVVAVHHLLLTLWSLEIRAYSS